MMEKRIKVLVVDDQADLAESISSVLKTDAKLEVVGTACDGFDALEKIPATKPQKSKFLDLKDAYTSIPTDHLSTYSNRFHREHARGLLQSFAQNYIIFSNNSSRLSGET